MQHELNVYTTKEQEHYNQARHQIRGSSINYKLHYYNYLDVKDRVQLTCQKLKIRCACVCIWLMLQQNKRGKNEC